MITDNGKWENECWMLLSHENTSKTSNILLFKFDIVPIYDMHWYESTHVIIFQYESTKMIYRGFIRVILIILSCSAFGIPVLEFDATLCMPMSPVMEQLFNLTYAYHEATKGSINNSWYESLKLWNSESWQVCQLYLVSTVSTLLLNLNIVSWLQRKSGMLYDSKTYIW